MKAISITQPGGPEVLAASRHSARPVRRKGELLVKVAAAGVNRPDVLQRKGGYPPPPGAPDTPGLEIAGEVVATGGKTSRYRKGDLVCALVPGGGYAEYCIAAEDNALPVPAGISLIEAAAIPETYFTVWTNVFERGRLQAGETILIHGGSSGIGTTAIQLAKAFGSKVVVTAGDDAKCEACRKLGADLAINYRTQDYVEVLKTQEIAPDVILDMVGGDYVARNLRCLAVEGRIVNIAFQQGSKVEIDLHAVDAEAGDADGFNAASAQRGAEGRHCPGTGTEGLAAARCGPLQAGNLQDLSAGQAAEAHRLMESSAHVGKIVLVL